MAKIAITVSPQIVKNGGPITKDVYKSHATQLWQRGSLLELASGLLTPVTDTSSGSAGIDTDGTGTSAALLFVALEDHLTAGSVFVAVQQILTDSVLEMQLLASGSTDPKSANVSQGTAYAGYQIDGGTMDGTALWGVDVDNTTKPVFRIVDVQSNYLPFKASADYDFVYVQVLPAILA
jgi:hypothetical protein